MTDEEEEKKYLDELMEEQNKKVEDSFNLVKQLNFEDLKEEGSPKSSP